MVAPTVEELRELSRRSRRAQAWGFLAILAALMLFPALVLLETWVSSSWLAVAALVVGGALFTRYAFVAGEERGAFRKVFRRLADERKTRTIVPSEPAPSVAVQVK